MGLEPMGIIIMYLPFIYRFKMAIIFDERVPDS
jgi:hypothetical protein